MDVAAPHASAPLVTPAGFVDAESADAAEVILWGDAAAVRAFLLSGDAPIRPGRQHTAA